MKYRGMNRSTFTFFTWFAAISLCHSITISAAPFHTENVVLYQPDEVLKQRVPSVKALGDYIQKLESICEGHFGDSAKASNLAIVVAVKPGGRSRFWLVPSANADPNDLEKLRTKLAAVPPVAVEGGPLAFALNGSIAGGIKTAADQSGKPPIPKEWVDAMGKTQEAVSVPEGFLKAVWPDDQPDLSPSVHAPDGFVLQKLEPTGGEIERPKDWFYAEAHNQFVFKWTISAEDSTKGPYTTGVKIQTFTHIKQNTGKSPKQFILDFAEAKKHDAKVLKSCAEKADGLFTRICLETEEGPCHILYSLFWGNKDLDIAVVTIAGTTLDRWKDHAATFDRMSAFKLIDLSKFKEPKDAPK